MLRKLLEERRASQETHNDMLAHLMKTEENKYKLSDEEIIDRSLKYNKDPSMTWTMRRTFITNLKI